jgi:hypothetical protein
MSHAQSFDLIDGPWIPVLWNNGRYGQEKVSGILKPGEWKIQDE